MQWNFLVKERHKVATNLAKSYTSDLLSKTIALFLERVCKHFSRSGQNTTVTPLKLRSGDSR